MNNPNSPIRKFQISPLKSLKSIRTSSPRSARKLVATLVLTSLVDAFSIILLYLLFNQSDAGIHVSTNSLVLPSAHHVSEFKNEPTLQIKGQSYLLNQKEVSLKDLSESLRNIQQRRVEQDSLIHGSATKKISEEPTLLIVADTSTDFSLIKPVLASASYAGFHNYKFVVSELANSPQETSQQMTKEN